MKSSTNRNIFQQFLCFLSLGYKWTFIDTLSLFLNYIWVAHVKSRLNLFLNWQPKTRLLVLLKKRCNDGTCRWSTLLHFRMSVLHLLLGEVLWSLLLQSMLKLNATYSNRFYKYISQLSLITLKVWNILYQLCYYSINNCWRGCSHFKWSLWG